MTPRPERAPRPSPAVTALSLARIAASRAFPYFVRWITLLVFREAPSLGTVAITRAAIFLYDPVTVARWTARQLAGAIVHEILHLVLRHAERFARVANHALANLACDLVINQLVRAAGLDLPPGAVFPADLGLPPDLTAEEYHALLERKKEDQQKQQDPSGSEGDEGDEGDEPGSSGQPSKDPGEGEGEGSGADQSGGPSEAPSPADRADGPPGPSCGQGWCGSGAGREVPGEPPASDPAGRSEAEQAVTNRVAAEEIRTLAAQKGRGLVPGALLRWAEVVLGAPKVRWQERLARLLRASYAVVAGASDYSYARPSRRQAGAPPTDPLRPAMVARTPLVAAWADTSGSMGPAELSTVVSEVRGIIRALGAEVVFAASDTETRALRRVRSWQDVPGLLKGGGGTDFRPVFIDLARLRPRPDVIIALTDGQGPAPEEAPRGIKVIWVLVGPCRTRPCSWGEVVEVEP